MKYLFLWSILCCCILLKAQPQHCLSIVFAQKGPVRGDTVDVQVSVRGFVKIYALDYVAEWDPNVLQLINVVELDPLLRVYNIESPNIGFPAEGSSRFAWNDELGFNLGETLVDNSSFYTLRFLIKDKSKSRTKIGLSSSRSAEYVYSLDGSSEALTANFLSAGIGANLVLKANVPVSSLKFQDICTTKENCELGNILLQVTGGTAPYQYFSRAGNGTLYRLRLTNLAPGKYPLLVIDAKNDTIEAQVNITAPPSGTGPVLQASVHCFPTKPDSATIRVEASGSKTQYVFDWSEGSYAIDRSRSQIKVASNLVYAVTVSDANGCETLLENLSASECIASDTLPALRVSSATVVSGGIFCSEVAITNTKSLLGLQFALRWNPDQLKFLTLKLVDAELAISNFNLTDTKLGSLRFSKNYNSTIPLVTKKTLFELCFQAQLFEDTSYITFDNPTFPIEIISGDDILGAKTYPAEISIKPALWPGDGDRSGRVNHFDLLPIGLAFGNRGPARPSASLNWEAQAVDPWGKNLPGENIDLAFVDANGDGFVEYQDTMAIQQNWQRFYQDYKPPLAPTEIRAAGIPLFVRADTLKTSAGQLLSIELGSGDVAATQVYGVAFSIVYNPKEVAEQRMRFYPRSSWLGTLGADLMAMQRNDARTGRIDVALVRTNQQPSSGRGKIGELYLALESTEIQRLGKTLNLEIQNVRLINQVNQSIAHDAQNTILPLARTVNTRETTAILNQFIQVYPQPVDQSLWVNTGGLHLKYWQLLGVNGQQVAAGLKLDQAIAVNHLPGGMYTLRVVCTEGVALKKCLVTH